MNSRQKSFSIIFHSGSFDRVYHGFSIALACGAMGRDVRLFFTYWALGYIVKGKTDKIGMAGEEELHKEIVGRNMNAGHIQKISEQIRQANALGVKMYACTNSMGLLNIARDELVTEVDKSMGLTTFLSESGDAQMLFI